MSASTKLIEQARDAALAAAGRLGAAVLSLALWFERGEWRVLAEFVLEP